MKKLLIGTALLFTALPFTLDDVTPTVSEAQARIGHPLTPMSVAGVHRRAMRRTFGVGANLGYHPVARAALYGAAATGAGYYGAGYGGWGGYGYGAPSYAGFGWGGGWGGWGFNRPLYSCSGPFCPGQRQGGWGGGWGAPGWGGGWGWRRW